MSPTDQAMPLKRVLSHFENQSRKKERAESLESRIEALFSSFNQEIACKLDELSSRLETLQEKLPRFPDGPFVWRALNLPAIRDRYLFRSNEEFFTASNKVFEDIEDQTNRQHENSAFSKEACSSSFLPSESDKPLGSFNFVGYNPLTKEPKSCSHDNLTTFTVNCLLDGQTVCLPVFAVFDGHGTHGDLVSSFAKNHIKEYLQESLDTLNRLGDEYELANSLIYSTLLLDSGYNQYQKKYLSEDPCSGSTALIVLLTPNMIFTSSLGDSRAVLVRRNGQNHQQLSFDQAAGDPIAKRKAKKRAVLHSSQYKDSSGQTQTSYRILGTNMTGALGNFHTVIPRNSSLKMLEVKPQVTVLQRSTQDLYLLLSSDGVYFKDISPSTNQVADFLCQTNFSATNAAKYLAEISRKAGSADDIGVIVADISADQIDLGSYISGLEDELEQSNSSKSTFICSENSLEQSP